MIKALRLNNPVKRLRSLCIMMSTRFILHFIPFFSVFVFCAALSICCSTR